MVLDPAPGKLAFGIHLLIGKNYTVFLADTTINERPSAAELAQIAIGTAEVAKKLGHEPRVAFLSYSTFGNPPGRWLENIREAVALLDAHPPGFEYEGEMAPDAALNPQIDGQLSVQPPVRPGQRAGHAGAAIGQPLGQAAARTGRRADHRADADRDGKAGPDRGDELQRQRHPDAGGAGGGGGGGLLGSR